MPKEPDEDALVSLNAAIAAALRSGATPEDISRVFRSATGTRHNFQHGPNREHGWRSAPFYRYGLLVCAVMVFIANIASFSGKRSQILWSQASGTQWLEELQNLPQNNFLTQSNVTSENQTIQRKEEIANSTGNNFTKGKVHHLSDYHASLLGFEKSFRNLQDHVLEVALTDRNENGGHVCPLDTFFDSSCQTRSGGTVCIFPGAILKKGHGRMFEMEYKVFPLLNDTRFFPELYYSDKRCKTQLQENVRLKGQKRNSWCSNYTYYEEFYKSAFEIFTANNIVPIDLNTCCNTIVNDDLIRIIDFGKYKFKEPSVVVEENKKMLEKILNDVKNEHEKHIPKCARKREEAEKRRRKEEENQKRKAARAERERQLDDSKNETQSVRRRRR